MTLKDLTFRALNRFDLIAARLCPGPIRRLTIRWAQAGVGWKADLAYRLPWV